MQQAEEQRGPQIERQPIQQPLSRAQGGENERANPAEVPALPFRVSGFYHGHAFLAANLGVPAVSFRQVESLVILPRRSRSGGLITAFCNRESAPGAYRRAVRRGSMAAMFETFDHTADLGLRIRAPDLESLFVEAATALCSISGEDLPTVAS